MTYARAVTAVLLDSDHSTVISGALDNAFDVTFMDEKNGFGFGSLSLPYTDPNRAQLQRGRFVRVLVAGTVRFTFRIEGTPRYVPVDEAEEIGEHVEVSGRGHGCIFEGAVTYPETLEVNFLDYPFRLFSFASFFFPNGGGWGNSQALYEYKDGVASGTGRVEGVVDTGADPDDPGDNTLILYPSPIGFPWPNAYHNGDGSAPTPTYSPTYWMIADGAAEDDIGTHFFRGYFTLAGEQEVTFLVTADNFFTFFLQGVPLLAELDDTLAWLGWYPVTRVLPAGFYVVGLAVENIAADIPYNPGGGLFNAIATGVYPGEIETSLTLALLSSDDGWDSIFDANEWPGWTIAQIIDQLISEAVARGCLTQFGSVTWTDTQDSDGNDWNTADPDTTTMFVPTFQLRLGDTLGAALDQAVQEGWLDWHFQGENLDLDGWAPNTPGTDTGISFHRPTDPNNPASGNIRGFERAEAKPYANALLVQWAGAVNVEVDDPTEIAAYGSREEDIYSTDCATIAEAERQGRIELQRRIKGAQAAVLMTIEPASAADCPYEAFGIRDLIDIPNIAEDGTDTVEVLSITCSQDPEGNAIWAMEVNERLRATGREAIDLLRSIGGKTHGSAGDQGRVDI